MEDSDPLHGFWLEGDSLAPPCQADLDIVEEILTLANPNDRSILYDLGCGDGRICLRASSRYGCRSLGCEIEENLYKDFVKAITDLNLSELVSAVHGDLREVDFTAASIIVLYLLPESIEELKPKLIECLSNEVTIICNTFGLKGIIPVQKVLCGHLNGVTLFMYNKRSLIPPS